MRLVELHLEAAAEAEEAYRWYEEQWPGLGAAFLDELDTALQRIAETPNAWPSHFSPCRRYHLHRFPYGIVYL